MIVDIIGVRIQNSCMGQIQRYKRYPQNCSIMRSKKACLNLSIKSGYYYVEYYFLMISQEDTGWVKRR